MLRRVAAFAEPFTGAAAAEVLAGWPPVAVAALPTILAGLADQSLLIAVAAPGGTRYRALETIRQYGMDRLDEAGESRVALSRHLGWCLDRSATLESGVDAGARAVAGAWRAAFDDVADELRAGLAWAASDAGHRPQAYLLASRLADLAFVRGLPGEAQRRYGLRLGQAVGGE